MKLLAIETATGICSVALADDEGVRAELALNIGKVHAERLAVVADWLLKQVGWRTGDVDVVAVSSGPGSFTGLRIGLSFAKGFGLPGDCRLVLVPTLQGLAFRLGPSERPICPVLRARRGELYAAVYAWQDGEPVEEVPPRVVTDSELVDAAPAGALLTGEVEKLPEDLLHRLVRERDVREAPPWLRTASAGSIALLGLRRAAKGQFEDLFAAEPFYLQEFIAQKPKAPV